jgi:hypothetical protein
VRTVTEVRGWALSDDPLIDLRVDGLWHAFAL